MRVRSRGALALALAALLMGSALARGTACPPQGDAKSDRVKALNLLKNREIMPTWGDYDTHVSLAAILAPGQDAQRWSNDKGATIRGYVIDVKPGGMETVNCHARDLADRDTHIEIALRPGAPKTARMIVEVTPRWRLRMATQGVDWSTSELAQVLPGHWVSITGWLFFDTEHKEQSENTAPGRASDWRATAWEIHPITAMTLVAPPSTLLAPAAATGEP